jgi:hypothetical protein
MQYFQEMDARAAIDAAVLLGDGGLLKVRSFAGYSERVNGHRPHSRDWTPVEVGLFPHDAVATAAPERILVSGWSE